MRPKLLLLSIFLCFAASALANFGPFFAPSHLERTKLQRQHLWNWGHHFSRVTIENQRVPDVLGRVLDYNFTLPRTQLQRGLAYVGSACRLRRVVRDLLGRRDVKLGVIGGSVSWGEGASQRGVTDWFSVFSSYMIHAFPESNVTTRNGCTPGVQSPYMIMCMDLSVDPDVDMVFVEYTLNDGHDPQLYDNRIVKDTERLVRRLLALPKRPAVVLMHMPAHYLAAYPRGHPKGTDSFLPFYFTSEDAQGALSKYYDVQGLSLRTALYRLAQFLEKPGFRWEEVMADHHPGDTGHKIMADLAAYLVQETALGLLMHPFGAADDEVLGERLPLPMYPGNLPPDKPMCIMYDQFKALAIYDNGWEYVDEGTPKKPKPGFVAVQPGAMLKIRIDTDRSDTANPNEDVHVFFHHLKSYEHMGTARFSCEFGCRCEKVEVDAHINEKVSQLFLAELQVSQSRECVVVVTVLEGTASGEHKFKLAGVVVSEQPGKPSGIYSLSGDNKPFGLQQHNGDSAQVTITKAGVFGVRDRHHHRRGRHLHHRLHDHH